MSFLVLIAINCFCQLTAGSVQGDIDYLANNMDVRYDVIDNLKSDSTFLSRITLTNQGQSIIKQGDWAVYFCNIRMMESRYLKHNPAGYVIPGNYGIRLTHINGCLHKFETTSDFKDIATGSSFKFEFVADYWSVARSDVMPRWYVTAKGLSPRVIKNTDNKELKFVGNFDTREKWKRFVADLYNPYTPKQRYDKYYIADSHDSAHVQSKIIPTPVQMTLDTANHVVVESDWIVFFEAGLENEAALLKQKLKLTVSTSPKESKVIKLVTGEVSLPAKRFPSMHESYSLEVNPSKNAITITGNSSAGVFYGVQTLLGLQSSMRKVFNVSIKDAPRYAYRGMHLDVARNFVAKEHVLKLLDVMAVYKLNKFHFHLTDDEGWRLEIPELPELTGVGSNRCFDLHEQHCILSQLGSGPDNSTSGSGHYSVSDYKEILRYAKKRHIQVIPEFDIPGHGHAAIKAMAARYENFLTLGKKHEAEKYLLTEVNDTSRYLSIQYFSDNAVNPCLESTYNFIDHVVKALVTMHNDTQPLTIFHFGGDEVAHGAWINSTACGNLIRRLGLDHSDENVADMLKDHFVQRVASITSNYSLQLAGWEDGLMDVNSVPYDRSLLRNSRVYGYAWNNIWEWGGGKRAYELANAGYQVIMSQATHLYFDQPYEPDPEERGYYWATRFTDTRKVFGFMPDDLFANIETERSGEPLTREELCKTQGECPDLVKKKNVVGIQGHLWTETVRSRDQMFYMIFPRLLALAERAWHKASWEDILNKKERDAMRTSDWVKFANTLGYNELAQLDKMGITYRVPSPGASYDGKKLKAMATFPGLTVEYSIDGKTWKEVGDDSHVEGKKVKLRTRSADGSRYSRLVEMEVPDVVKGKSPHLITSKAANIIIVAFIGLSLM
ncbi:beta-hexosaminidase-like isoform X2 [Montipora foliosa]|uniref:beta-hexosaminidase-like isoform X2 n=2 Tax=Montipora foliosa TaxID=591990 RepID=UPI0035F19C7E